VTEEFFSFGNQNGAETAVCDAPCENAGYQLANDQFRTLQGKFAAWSIPLPPARILVFADAGNAGGQ